MLLNLKELKAIERFLSFHLDDDNIEENCGLTDAEYEGLRLKVEAMVIAADETSP